MSVVGPVDRFQRRHRAVGFPLAVVYKYFDDQGPYLAAVLSYYAFIAIFPLLLISSSVLGFVLQDDPELRDRLLDTAFGQFPIVGTQLGRPEGLTGSTSAIVVGALAALYGSLGLGQALQNASNVAWSVPRNSRANPFLMRLRSLLLLVIGGLAVVALAVVTSLITSTEVFGTALNSTIDRAVAVAAFLLTIVVFMSLFRLFAVKRVSWRTVAPGAVAIAVLWQLLQVAGQNYVGRVVNRANEMNSVFALVLGLMAFIFAAAVMFVLGLELNVVIARRLYPRALLTPFTDRVSLTEADQRAYELYAKAQRHKGFESISVRFDRGDDSGAPPDPA